MIRFLIAIPAVLSFLTLAAHFMRGGQLLVAGFCVIAPFLLILRRPWAVLLVQFALLAGAALWLWTMWEISEIRAMMGKPATRMTIILTIVAAFHVLSAVLLELRAFRLRESSDLKACGSSGTTGFAGSIPQ